MATVRVRYQTYEFGKTDIHIRSLRDRQQFDEADQAAANAGIPDASWPLFGIVWDSGEVLARMMHSYDIGGLRILEAGCGIGLASLVLQQRQANITASDHHPSVQGYLDANAKLNGLHSIEFQRADWANADSDLGLFDLIIGSDLLYERDAVDLLTQFVGRHSKPDASVMMIDPGRGLQGRFRSGMQQQGFAQCNSENVRSDSNDAYRGRCLTFERPAEQCG